MPKRENVAEESASVHEKEMDAFTWNGWDVSVLDVPDDGHGHDRWQVLGSKPSILGDRPVEIGSRIVTAADGSKSIEPVMKSAPILTVGSEGNAEAGGLEGVSILVHAAIAAMADEDARVAALAGEGATEAEQRRLYWNAQHRLHRHAYKKARGESLTADELVANDRNQTYVLAYGAIAGDSLPAVYDPPAPKLPGLEG